MIWLTQWLCPKRHCSIALAWDDGETTAQRIVARGECLYATGAINRWCGLCRSREIRPEAAPTRFQTMEEALPSLKAEEAAQERTRQVLEGGRN